LECDARNGGFPSSVEQQREARKTLAPYGKIFAFWNGLGEGSVTWPGTDSDNNLLEAAKEWRQTEPVFTAGVIAGVILLICCVCRCCGAARRCLGGGQMKKGHK